MHRPAPHQDAGSGSIPVRCLLSKLLLLMMVNIHFLASSSLAQDIVLYFGEDIAGEPGDRITVSVTTSNLTGLSITNFEFDISFDAALLTVTLEDITAGPQAQGMLSHITSDHRIRVAYASSTPLSGEALLFTFSGILGQEGKNNEGLRVNQYLLGDGSLEVVPPVPYTLSITSGQSSDLETTHGPGIFQLFQNYPNPFNRSSLIVYTLPVSSTLIWMYSTIWASTWPHWSISTRPPGVTKSG